MIMYAVFGSKHKKILLANSIGLFSLNSVFAIEVKVPQKDNSFRGGAIGKGGKIKYQRR
jgi:hypothetical protein